MNVASPVDPASLRLVPSVLDRLLLVDDNETAQLQDYDIASLRRDVRRSLEELLNARRRCMPIARELRALAASIYLFGIPDFSEAAYSSDRSHREFCKQVKLAVEEFEPRLTSVRVDTVDTQARDRVLRFRIHARLLVRPRPETVIYDSLMDPTTCNFEVRAS